MNPVRCSRFSVSVLLSLLLVSCGNFARVAPDGSVTIQQGFASSIQESTMQVKRTKEGVVTVTAAQSNYDGTSVPNNITGTVGTGVTAKYAFKTADSNNQASTAGKVIDSKTQLGAQKLSNDAAAKAGQQANFGKLIDKGTFSTGQTLPTPK